VSYQRLTHEERFQIQALLVRKTSVRDIAQVLKRHPSTISREIRRNRPGGRFYRATKAALRAKSLRINQHPKYKISGSLEKDLIAFLKLGWSPEQISGHWKRNKIAITHETIYQYIYRKTKKKVKLFTYFCPENEKDDELTPHIKSTF